MRSHLEFTQPDRSAPSASRAGVVRRRLELLRSDGGEEDVVEEAAQEPIYEDALPGVGAEWPRGSLHVTGIPADGTDGVVPFATHDPAPAAWVPVPGRHASRRRISWPDLLPAALRGRIGLDPAQVTVVAIVVVIGLAVTCYLLLRSSAHAAAPDSAVAVVPAAPLATLAATSSGSGGTPENAASAGAAGAVTPGVTVDVEGKVRHPGIVVLHAGARVVDAIRAAGGVAHRRDLGGLNLAAPVSDGQQIVVGAGGAASAGAATGQSASGTGAGEKISLSSATADQLDTIPGVGPVTAESILAWRAKNGSFHTVDELLEVDGIGPGKLAKIEPYVVP